jgi:drug/metabolite transporter (DMT)-like permease
MFSFHYELAALGAATCWALTGMIAPVPAAHLGALAFNRLRQVFGTLFLAVYVFASGAWQSLTWEMMPLLVISGLLGIFVGDSLLFTALNRLGPRRAGILFAFNAPLAALLGWNFLGETLSLTAVAGIAVTAAVLPWRFCLATVEKRLWGWRPSKARWPLVLQSGSALHWGRPLALSLPDP